MTNLQTDYTVKSLRELFAYAQGWLPDTNEGNYFRAVFSDLIRECDRQRPVGRDGVHGDLHTNTCGCEDK